MREELKQINNERSSRPNVFCKNGALSTFAKPTGKHPRQSLFFNKVVGLRPVTLLKKRLRLRRLSLNSAKPQRTPPPPPLPPYTLQNTSGGCLHNDLIIKIYET